MQWVSFEKHHLIVNTFLWETGNQCELESEASRGACCTLWTSPSGAASYGYAQCGASIERRRPVWAAPRRPRPRVFAGVAVTATAQRGRRWLDARWPFRRARPSPFPVGARGAAAAEKAEPLFVAPPVPVPLLGALGVPQLLPVLEAEAPEVRLGVGEALAVELPEGVAAVPVPLGVRGRGLASEGVRVHVEAVWREGDGVGAGEEPRRDFAGGRFRRHAARSGATGALPAPAER